MVEVPLDVYFLSHFLVIFLKFAHFLSHHGTVGLTDMPEDFGIEDCALTKIEFAQ